MESSGFHPAARDAAPPSARCNTSPLRWLGEVVETSAPSGACGGAHVYILVCPTDRLSPRDLTQLAAASPALRRAAIMAIALTSGRAATNEGDQTGQPTQVIIQTPCTRQALVRACFALCHERTFRREP